MLELFTWPRLITLHTFDIIAIKFLLGPKYSIYGYIFPDLPTDIKASRTSSRERSAQEDENLHGRLNRKEYR